jgi:short-subunit dehydrogenase
VTVIPKSWKKEQDYRIEKTIIRNSGMKNIIIIGAGGNIAKLVTDILVKNDDIKLTLFLRNKSRLMQKPDILTTFGRFNCN